MTNKFKNKYGWNAAYFVTICTKNRVCWFGDIVNGVMELSPMGRGVGSSNLLTPTNV